ACEWRGATMNIKQNRSVDSDKQAPASRTPAAQGTAVFADQRAVAASQRMLAAGIQQSAHVVAQRALGEAIHRSPAMAARPNHTGLPNQLKEGIESLSGTSMADVKVHYNSGRPAQVQAHAFAQGTQIHVGPGQERHVAHEAWHVVQQKQGRVPAT